MSTSLCCPPLSSTLDIDRCLQDVHFTHWDRSEAERSLITVSSLKECGIRGEEPHSYNTASQTLCASGDIIAYSFIHSCSQQMLTEHLLCGRFGVSFHKTENLDGRDCEINKLMISARRNVFL